MQIIQLDRRTMIGEERCRWWWDYYGKSEGQRAKIGRKTNNAEEDTKLKIGY